MNKLKNNGDLQICLAIPTEAMQSANNQAPMPNPSVQNETGSFGEDDSLLQTMDAIRTTGEFEVEFKQIEPKFPDSI